MNASDVVFACVAENRPDWYRMVENIAVSLRNFGGRLAGARFVAYFVEGLDETSARLLRELGVELKVVERYDPAHPTSNKLRMFQDYAAHPDEAFLVALDCDTIVVRDFLDELRPGVVRARVTAKSHLTEDDWTRLLEAQHLTPAAVPTVTRYSKQEMPAPYLNSGVVIVPAEHAAALAETWTKYIDEFARQTAAGIEEAWTGYFADQVALALALLERDIPVEPLDFQFNLPTGTTLKKYEGQAGIAGPGLIHYHKRITDQALLLRSDSAEVNRTIDHVNAMLVVRAGRTPPAQPSANIAHRVVRKARATIKR